MVALNVGGGFEIDIAESGDFDAHFGKLNKSIDGLKERQRPIYRKLVVQGIVPATGPLILQIPMQAARGRIWNLTGASLIGADGHSAVTGAIGEIYTGDVSIPDPSSQVGIIATVPNFLWWSRNVVWAGTEEDVYAIVYGATAGATITFACRVLDYPDSAILSSGVPPIGVG